VRRRDALRALASHYVASLKAGKSALIVSPTWREIEEVTGEVRVQLRDASLLGTAASTVTAHEDLKWTRAQKRDLRNYRADMILTFHKPTADFRRGEWGKVTAGLPDRLLVQKTNGTRVQVTRKQPACFEVGTEVQLEVAPGERLLIRGNRPERSCLTDRWSRCAQSSPMAACS